MKTRTLTTVTVLLASANLIGCGPTEYGKQMRAEATERVNLVNAEITYDQARQSFETGQFDDALDEVASAITLAPKAPEGHILKGRILLETHRLEPALAAFMKAIELDERSAVAHYFAGIVFERWSDDEEAYNHFQTAYDLDSSSVQYALASAESLVAMGEFAAARTAVEEKLAFFEHNAALRHLLGQIALLEGDPAAAASYFNEARVLNPDDFTLLEDLAWAQFDAGQYGQCLESVREIATMTQEQRVDIRHLEARCLALMGRSAEAREVYVELTKVRPTDPGVWISLGLLSRELGDFRRVALSSVRVIALAPERYEGYMLKGMNERHHGNVEAAVTLFKQAAERSTTSPLPHLLLGQNLEVMGEPREALQAYARAEQIDPDNGTARMLIERLTSGMTGELTDGSQTWRPE